MNSDSKQCPESKLGQVYSVHTLDPACAHAAHALRLGRSCRAVLQLVVGRVVAVSQACRCVHADVSQLPSVTIQVCIAISYLSRAVSHAISRAYSVVSLRLHGRIVACLATHPAARLCARTAGRVAGPLGLIVATAGRVVAETGHVVAPAAVPSYPVSRYNPLYRDSNEQ